MGRKAIYIGIFLFAAASACSKERQGEPGPEPTPAAEPKAVGFSVDGNALTRGAVTSYADEIVSLGIFGYSTGTDNFSPSNSAHIPDLFNNREAARTITAAAIEGPPRVPAELTPWDYGDPTVFWPTDDEEKNTFFAYSPYADLFPEGANFSVSLTGGTYGYPQISYTVPENLRQQVDLLYSEHLTTATDGKLPTANINYWTNTANPGHVKYNMKHAMVWLRFIIAAVEEVDDPTTLPTDTKETYSILSFNFSGGNIYADGLFNIGTGTWSHPGGKKSAVYVFDHILRGEPLVVDAGTTTPLSSAGHSLMIIPQNFVYSTDQTTVSITYTHNDPSDPSDTEYYITLPFPDVRLVSAGYVMTYVVKISTSGAWIEFADTNTIEEWLEDPDTDIREVEAF